MTWPTIFDTRLDDFNILDLPGQQLAAAQATSKLNHLLHLNVKAAPSCQRLTAIMASMGPATNDVEVMEKMMEAGMNIAFLNMSFGKREEHVNTIKMLREAAANFSKNMGIEYPIAIAVGLCGRKIRTGRIADSYGDSVELITGETVRLTTDETYAERCSMFTVYVDFMYFAEQLKKGYIIFLDNESIELKVDMISATTLTCKIEKGGKLGSHKDIFVPHLTLNIPNYTHNVQLDIEMAIRNKVDIVIASFVSNADNVLELKNILKDRGKHIAIISSLSTIEGIRKYEEILEVSDAVMLTRQELGSELEPERLALAQKNLIARANKACVPVFISTQLLTFMKDHKSALRSELSDIANCVLDGADCLVLGAETAIGENPVNTVATMAETCREAECYIWTKQVFSDLFSKMPSPCDQLTAAAMSGVLASQRCFASAVIVLTASGKTARMVSKFRPRCPIIAITRIPLVARQMHMWRGVMPLIYQEEPPVGNWPTEVNKRIKFGVKWGIERGFMKVGDPMVTITGWKHGSGFTNTMRVKYVSREFAQDILTTNV